MADLEYDKDRPLYLPSGERMSVSQSHSALEQAYSSGRPVLIYVHGRAKGVGEPKKSVKEGIYGDLFDYGVSTIGFTWDADDGGYDETRPLASVEAFDQFLDTLKSFLSSPEAAGRPKPSILAHSMGNIIVSELAKENRLTSQRGDLFTNIVLSAAAVKTKRHHLWLRKIEISDHTYVMVNPKDKMLLFAGALFKPNMLGREVRKPGVTPEQAVYVDLSRLGVSHRYFVPSGQKGQKHLHSFFRQTLNGQAADMDAISDSQSMDGVNVRTIRRA